jgi:hypothetical protein
MGRFAQGIYKLKNPQKYVGNSSPKYRSGWEFLCMKTFDENPAILHWASEPVKIPYKDPTRTSLMGKNTIYVPDFFIEYVDKNGKRHAEIIEVKPSNHQILEKVGKNLVNQIQYVKNIAKWEAATAWCKQRGLKFRVVNENDLFHNPKQRK